jgi:hypothetical protein
MLTDNRKEGVTHTGASRSRLQFASSDFILVASSSPSLVGSKSVVGEGRSTTSSLSQQEMISVGDDLGATYDLGELI